MVVQDQPQESYKARATKVVGAEVAEAWDRVQFLRGGVQALIEGYANGGTFESMEHELKVYCFSDCVDKLLPVHDQPDNEEYLRVTDILYDPANWIPEVPVKYSGTWIQIGDFRKDPKVELHYAKRTRVRARSTLRKIINALLGPVAGEDEIQPPKDLSTPLLEGIYGQYTNALKMYRQTLIDQIEAEVLTIEKMTPYRLATCLIRYTKRKSTYLIPSQYRVASDNILRMFEQVGRSPYVRFKQYYQISGVEDQIHYAQTRGIPRKQAEVLIHRQGGYLTINVEGIYTN